MATTTTFRLLRNGWYASIAALTPAKLTATGQGFRRFPLEHEGPLREWSLGNPTASFRLFDLRMTSTKGDPGLMDPSAKWSVVEGELTIAYPTTPALYGTAPADMAVTSTLDMIEDVMEADARQIHDALVTGANYVTGQQLCEVVIAPPDRGDPTVWFQVLRVTGSFFEAQSI